MVVYGSLCKDHQADTFYTEKYDGKKQKGKRKIVERNAGHSIQFI